MWNWRVQINLITIIFVCVAWFLCYDTSRKILSGPYFLNEHIFISHNVSFLSTKRNKFIGTCYFRAISVFLFAQTMKKYVLIDPNSPCKLWSISTKLDFMWYISEEITHQEDLIQKGGGVILWIKISGKGSYLKVWVNLLEWRVLIKWNRVTKSPKK